MLPVLIMIGVGVVAYAAATGGRGLLHVTSENRHQYLSLSGHRLEVEDRARRELRHFHLSELDLWVIRTAGGRRPYDIVLGFGPSQLVFEEGTPGLGDVVDYLLQTPPPGTDLSRWGDAMDTRRRQTFVLLDRRKSA